jgi:hypothetical protein
MMMVHIERHRSREVGLFHVKQGLFSLYTSAGNLDIYSCTLKGKYIMREGVNMYAYIRN